MKRVLIKQMWTSNWKFYVRIYTKKSILIIFSFCLIVKPIIKIIFHDKELNTNSLTIIENTFDIIRCRIASNPSIGLDIQWFKNEQLILGKIID